jgi:hypothetical protein
MSLEGRHKLETWKLSETAEQISTKFARNIHWMVLLQICVFGADLKSNMAARVYNVFSLAEILKIFLSETLFSGFREEDLNVKS